MKSLNESKERLGQTIEQSKQLAEKATAEGRDMSPEEQKLFDILLDEHDKLFKDIARMERLQAAQMQAVKSERKSAPQVPEAAPESRIEFPRFSGTLRSFKPRLGETYREAQERAYRAGKWALATIYRNQAAATWCIEHGMDIRAHAEGTNSLGGYLVPDELDRTIIDLRETYGVFRRYAKVSPMASDTKSVPRRTGGLTAYFVGEAGGFTESTKAWDEVKLSAKKIGVLAKYSMELNEDAVISIADDLAAEAAYAIAYLEDNCGFNGTGTSSFGGIVGILAKMIDGSHAGSYYTAEGVGNTIDTYGEATKTTLAGLMSILPAYALARNPKWYVHPIGKALMFDRLVNAPLTSKADQASENIQSYCGYPIVTVPAWTETGTAITGATDFSNKIMCLFGCLDLAATLGDRRGTSVQVLNELYAANGQTGLIVNSRFDINVHDIGGAAGTAGPLVGLLGN